MGELPEVTATAEACGNCWKLWQVAGEARNMMENALFILIVIFMYNKPRPQTDSCVFSSLVSGPVASQSAASPDDCY